MDIDRLFTEANDLCQTADFEAARLIYQQILHFSPDNPRALHALGVVIHRGGGGSEESIGLVRQAIRLKPDYFDARCNLGNILVDLRRFSEAEECYKAVLAINPELSSAWMGMGNLYARKLCFEEALIYFGKASDFSPDAAAFVQTGMALKMLGRLDAAASAYRRALAVKSDCGEAFFGLATIYEAGANIVAAKEYAEKALELMPASSAAMQVLAGLYLASGKADDALEWYRRAVAANGGPLAFSNMLYAMNYCCNCSPEEIFTESCRWESLTSVCLESCIFTSRSPGRLRIGYVSPDFRQHSVAYFFAPLLSAHNRNRFEIHCYSNVLTPDKVTAVLMEGAEYWHDIRRLSDPEAVDLIRNDRIDILVDLAGHTADNRLGIFARRAAPVQMTWLGYPNTSGLSAMDYRITDVVADPEDDSDRHHSEQLIRLPDGFLCYRPPADSPGVSLTPALVNGYVTFGSFNNPAKITEEVVEIWSRILLAVPGSRLLLKSKTFCDPVHAEMFSSAFVARGVPAERVMCVPATETISKHLACYNQIDIALDPFPYNGTTTTFEALYMGVPVITLRGNRHAGRVGASILTSLGMNELIAETVVDYLSLAVSLSEDLSRLSLYRAELRGLLVSSPLLDAAIFADSLEDAYRSVWRTYSHGHPACSPDFEDLFLQARQHFNLGEYAQTRSIYEAILADQPDNARALHGLGVVSYKLGDSEKAINNIASAIRIHRDYTVALVSLGNVYKESGRVIEALDCFRKALILDPGFSEIHSNILMNMHYLPQYSRDEIFAEARHWSDYHARRPFHKHLSTQAAAVDSRKIRIGFVSADFRKHPVGFIIIPFFFGYDRQRFELVCYHNSSEYDAVSEQIVSLVDKWRVIDGMPDRVVWEIMQADSVDILVDLSGHTAGNRLALFSLRPAPAQVSWLGYFDTTGLEAIDYILTDRFFTPPGEENWFTEKAVYLPDCRFCYAPPEFAPKPVAPPAIKNGFITFGSFNNIAKLTDEVIAVWVEILLHVKGARLIIKWKCFRDQDVVARYQQLFRRQGLDPVGCVEFRGESGHQEMLKMYGDVDIALDPFPFSGGLTSLEALWMGVPLITLEGDRPVSRQTASFLEVLNHGELVADTVIQYRDIAIKMAGDMERLSHLRAGLREEMRASPLCNAAAFSRNISAAFEGIALTHRSPAVPVIVRSKENVDELELRCHKAGQLVEAGELDAAEACYEEILKDVKDYPRALHALGVVRYRRGGIADGIDMVRKALKFKADYVDAWLNLGKMLHEQQQYLEASECYRHVIQIRPNDLTSHFLRAKLLALAGICDKAIIAYQELLLIAPEHFDGIFSLGQILLDARRFEDAEPLLQRARELSPENAAVQITLGNCALSRHDFVSAEKFYKEACRLNPESAEAHTNLGHLYSDSPKIEEAIRHCRVAVDLKPEFALGWLNLGVALNRGLQHSEAIAAYRNALSLDSNLSVARSNMLMLMQYMPGYSQQDIFTESLAWNDCHGTGSEEIWKRHAYAACKNRKLRIGFVSADFKLHPVSYHFLPVVENYDRSACEFVCYSNTDVFDEMSAKIKSAVCDWRNITALSDDQSAEMICHDRIDILVDLSGHTAGNRLTLFARKPAPIQVSWLGYFNTTGLSTIDYLISDAVTIPVTEEQYFSEKVLRLPRTRFCYSPAPESPSVEVRHAEQSGLLTFASFNNATKLSSECIGLWSAVLAAVPSSRLILKWASYEDEWVRGRIVRAFADRGIGSDRLEFRGMSLRGEMFAQYGEVDICLDTYPFCGGATTCDALWMGVPVVTLSGRSPISRQSASFLACIGHPELVADSSDAYVEIVKNLAADVCRRTDLRRTLRGDMSASLLCDGAVFTRNLEALFRQMVEERRGLFSSDTEIKIDYFAEGLKLLVVKNFIDAAECFERVVALGHNNADAHNNLGIAYFEIGFREEAKIEFKRATKISPGHAEAWKNLGKAIKDTRGNPEIAARCFRKAVALKPDFDDAWMMLGITLLDRGRCAEAIKCFQKTLILNPDNCDAHSNLLFSMNYLPNFSQEAIFQESCRWNEQHAAAIMHLQICGRSDRKEGNRLRIGYVSGDFKRHPVGYHLLPVLANYDRNQFEVYCYATLREKDELTAKMQEYVTGWRDISTIADAEAARLIGADQIDILIDLSGHSGGHRLLLFASKPAPVQVSWLGYFNTTGVKAIDYLISDETTIALHEEQWFSEQIIRLPGSRFCYAPPDYAPLVVEPPVLENGVITFGSFNNIAKLTANVIELWSRVLLMTTNSRLIIKWATLGRKKERDRLLKRFAHHGITGDRLELRGRSPHADMLKEYGDIDIALDPFPFSGGMTSCEALWMGVPVLTLPGDKPAGRQTAAFLQAIGLSELISASPDQLIARAVELAADHDKLKSIRVGLRKRMTASTLCDGVKFTRNLEAAYRLMWQRRVETVNHG